MCLALHISRLFSTASSLLRRTPPPQLEDEHTDLRDAVKNAQDLLAANFALPAHLEATGIELSQLQEVEDPRTLPVVDEWNGGEASVLSALRATVAVREACFWIEQVCAPSGGTSTPCIDMSSSTCA